MSKPIISRIGTDAVNAPKLHNDLRRKLISYANCNRCELTPQDARELLLILEVVPSYFTVIPGKATS
jgi:hypothetical protein